MITPKGFFSSFEGKKTDEILFSLNKRTKNKIKKTKILVKFRTKSQIYKSLILIKTRLYITIIQTY